MRRYDFVNWILMGVFDIAVIGLSVKFETIFFFIDVQRKIETVIVSSSYIRGDSVAPNGLATILLLAVVGTIVTQSKSIKNLIYCIFLIFAALMLSNMDSWSIDKILINPMIKEQCYLWLRNTDLFIIACSILLAIIFVISNREEEEFHPMAPIFNRIIIITSVITIVVLPRFMDYPEFLISKII